MSVAGQQSPPGRAVLAPRDSGTSEVYFPWELDDAYYLRRVLAHAGAALLVVRPGRDTCAWLPAIWRLPGGGRRWSNSKIEMSSRDCARNRGRGNGD